MAKQSAPSLCGSLSSSAVVEGAIVVVLGDLWSSLELVSVEEGGEDPPIDSGTPALGSDWLLVLDKQCMKML